MALADAEPGQLVFRVEWVANPFRGDRFEELWAPVAEAALDYGASAYAFLRSAEDPIHFTQLAWFDSKLEWERYWYSEELAEARAGAAGLFQVPLLPVPHRVVASGSREREPLEP